MIGSHRQHRLAKIKLDWSWKFLGGTKSDLIGAGNSLATQNQT
jgi:hypothetical protein